VIGVGDPAIRRAAKSCSSHATHSVNPVMGVLITEVPFYGRLLVPNPANFLEARFWPTPGLPAIQE
jgi:hypothetical protein